MKYAAPVRTDCEKIARVQSTMHRPEVSRSAQLKNSTQRCGQTHAYLANKASISARNAANSCRDLLDKHARKYLGTVLISSQRKLEITVMVNLIALCPYSQGSTYRDGHAVSRAQSLIWRYGAKPRKGTRSRKFLRQKEQRRDK